MSLTDIREYLIVRVLIVMVFLNWEWLNLVSLRFLYLDSYFPIYVNNLPKTTINSSQPVLFTDNISLIITNHSLTHFRVDMNAIFAKLNQWLNATLLTLK
jgi:hypothetical protein